MVLQRTLLPCQGENWPLSALLVIQSLSGREAVFSPSPV